MRKRSDRNKVGPLTKLVLLVATMAAVFGPQTSAQAHNQYIDRWTFVWATNAFCVSAEGAMTHYDESYTTATWTSDGIDNCRAAAPRNAPYIHNQAAFFSNGNLCGSYPERQLQDSGRNFLTTTVGFSIAPWCPGHATMDTWNWAAYGSYWYPQEHGGYFPQAAWHDF